MLDKGLNIEIISMGIREDGRLADNLPNVTVHNVPRAYRFRLHTKLSSGIDFLMQYQRPKDIARYRWLREKLKEISPELLHVHFAGEAAEWAHALALDIGLPCTSACSRHVQASPIFHYHPQISPNPNHLSLCNA